MPRPPSLPDSSALRNHLLAGLTYGEIAELYGVTENAVYRQLDQAGLVQKRVGYGQAVPWRIPKEHLSRDKDHEHAEALRYLAKRDRGDTIPPHKVKRLEKWLQARYEDDMVVDYDPERGFFLVPRVPEDGTGFVRHPAA